MSGAEWLEGTALAAAVRDSIWLYPAAETLHILGLALLVGSAATWDARLLGFSRRIAVSDLERHLLPAARLGFAMAVPTGILLFLPDATAIWANPAFRVKLIVIAAAVLNTLLFHARLARSMSEWDVGTVPPRSVRLVAGASLLLWTAALVAGRLIAYV